jgi:hypothetical protein
VFSLLLCRVAVAQLIGGPDSPDEVGESFEADVVWGRPFDDLQPTGFPEGGFGSVLISPDAAHRGQRGLRIQPSIQRVLADGGIIGDSAFGPLVQFGSEDPSLLTPDAGLYFRTWLRVNTWPAPPRSPILFNFFAEAGLALVPSDGGWQARLYDFRPLPVATSVVRPLTWHLLEYEYLRFALSDGGVGGGNFRIWLDGRLHSVQEDVSPQTLRARSVNGGRAGYSLGIVEHFGGDLDGSVDYDDFRRSRRPPASQLVLELVSAPASAECPDVRQVRARLTSSQGTVAPAPYALTLQVDAGPNLIAGVLDGGCIQPGSIGLTLGQDAVTFGVSGLAAGVVSVSATDFLPATAALPDAGQPDSGVDAGPERLTPLLGCGCTGVEWPVALALVVATLPWRRRR